MLLLHSFWHTQSFPLHFPPLFFKHSSGRQWLRLHQDTRGAEAAGDKPEGTLMKHVFTTKARLGSGGERRWLLFESLHSVWRCGPHGCGACYPWKKTRLRWGYMPLSKPTHTPAWMAAVHLLPSLLHWKLIWNSHLNLACHSLVHPHLNVHCFPKFCHLFRALKDKSFISESDLLISMLRQRSRHLIHSNETHIFYLILCGSWTFFVDKRY